MLALRAKRRSLVTTCGFATIWLALTAVATEGAGTVIVTLDANNDELLVNGDAEGNEIVMEVVGTLFIVRGQNNTLVTAVTPVNQDTPTQVSIDVGDFDLITARLYPIVPPPVLQGSDRVTVQDIPPQFAKSLFLRAGGESPEVIVTNAAFVEAVRLDDSEAFVFVEALTIIADAAFEPAMSASITLTDVQVEGRLFIEASAELAVIRLTRVTATFFDFEGLDSFGEVFVGAFDGAADVVVEDLESEGGLAVSTQVEGDDDPTGSDQVTIRGSSVGATIFESDSFPDSFLGLSVELSAGNDSLLIENTFVAFDFGSAFDALDDDGLLDVFGGAGDDQIQLSNVRLTATGTPFPGDASMLAHIDAGSGNDIVTINGPLSQWDSSKAAHLAEVLGGDGLDELSVADLQSTNAHIFVDEIETIIMQSSSVADLQISGSNGIDKVTLFDVLIDNDLFIEVHGGNDKVAVTYSTVGGVAAIFLNEGDDVLAVGGIGRFRRGQVGHLYVEAGTGADKVGLQTLTVDEATTLVGGGGQDTASESRCTFGTAPIVTGFETVAGF